MKKKSMKHLIAAVAILCVLSPGISAYAAESYTVQSGDYLSKIAESKYGDAARWKAIYDSNRDNIKDPNIIYAGQTLVLPDAENVPVSEEAPAVLPEENSAPEAAAGESAAIEQPEVPAVAAEIPNGRTPITPKEISFFYDGDVNLKEIYYRTSENDPWIPFYTGDALEPGSFAYNNTGKITMFEGYFGVKLVFSNGEERVHTTNLVVGESVFQGVREAVNTTGEQVQFYISDGTDNFLDVDWF